MARSRLRVFNASVTGMFGVLGLAFLSQAAAYTGPAMPGGGRDLLSPVPAPSATGPKEQAFVEAEKAIRLGDVSRFRRLAKTLENYPLYPYLEYAELERRLSRVKPGHVDAFLAANADSPLAPRLRRRWLGHLAKRKRWDTFLRFYEPGHGVTLHCHYLHARIASGEHEDAYRQVADVWLSGKSQPKACDPVFESWIDAGHLSEDLVWERIWLAMQGHRTRLARYLSRFLSPEQHALVEEWIALRASPRRIKQFPEGVDEKLGARMRVYAVERLARSDPDAAAALWNFLSSRYSFPERHHERAYRRIGLAFARKGRPEGGEWLGRMRHADEYVRHWRLANAILNGRWRDALDALPDPEADGRNRERWQYWRARSLESLGMDAVAKSIYRSLAGERSYYGFLAADAVGLPYRFDDDPLSVDDDALIELAGTPPGRRIRALLSLGRTLDARREWYYWIRDLDVIEQARAAKLAQRWGWHDAGILTVARTPFRDDLVLRFPVAHEEAISRHASAQGLEPAMVLAMIRQESAFMTDAASPRGARGLMQLTPSTGRRVARSVGIPLKRRNELFDPALNLHLGTVYFRRLLDAQEGNPVLALGAYNAGPRKVDDWRPVSGSVPADIWIENITYTETREYIKRVLAYTVVYEHRLGKPLTPLSRRMDGITAPEEKKTG